jgi:O-antigen/teichoic acid export membrane protein
MPDKVFFGGLPSLLMPAFSAYARDGVDLRQIYVRSIEHMTGLQWPALAVLCILAHPIVRIVFGDQWLEAVPLVQIIALASVFSFSGTLNYPLLTSAGAIHHNLINNLIVLPISLAIMITAAFWGLKAVAWTWFITLPFQALVSMYFIQRHIDITRSEVMLALGRSFIVALFSAAGPLLVVAATGNNFDLSIEQAIAAIFLSAAGWSVGLWITRHPLVGEIQNLVAAIRNWHAAASAHRTGLKAQGSPCNTELLS